MDNLRKIGNKKIILISSILFAFIARFLWIDKVPNGISGDELTYIINAKAIFLSSRDISGLWNPFSIFIFQYPPYTYPQAELSYFLLSPFVGVFGFSLFWVRIPFVLLSVGSVFLIYLITKVLFNEKAGIASALIAAINPWSIFIGRTSYESTPAIFFYLLAFYMFLILKGRKIFLTIPILFLAFYSYLGTKVIFFPFVLVLVLFSFFVNKKRYGKEYLIVLGSSLFLVLLFAFVVFTTKGVSRAEGIINFNSPEIGAEVDTIRKISLPNLLTPLFENKYTVFSRVLLTKFFKSFSFDYLFMYGDNFFSIPRHGLFYVLDSLFLVLGFSYSYLLKRKAFFLLLTLMIIGVLPQVVYSNRLDNFSIHLSLMFAVLPIFIGVGISETLVLIKNKVYYYLVLFLTGFLYLFLVLNFLNIYFYQFPLKGEFDFHVRLLSKYLNIAKNSGETIYIFSPATPNVFLKHVFYTNDLNKKDLELVKKDLEEEKYEIKNLKFVGCDNTIDISNLKGIVVYDFNCGPLGKNQSHLAIPRLSDGGQSYQIFNDKICSKFNLKRYPYGIKISDFSIESMSVKNFCETFITSL